MSSTTPVTSANASPVTTRISQSSDGQSIIEPPNMTPTEPNTTPEDLTEQMMSKHMNISNANHVIKFIPSKIICTIILLLCTIFILNIQAVESPKHQVSNDARMSGGNSMMSESQLKYENERLKLALTHR